MTPEKVHTPFHREERTDPITGHTLTDTEGRPWIQEGDPDAGLRIYFDSKESQSRYESIPIEHPEQGLSRTLSNDSQEGYDEG